MLLVDIDLNSDFIFYWNFFSLYYDLNEWGFVGNFNEDFDDDFVVLCDSDKKEFIVIFNVDC